MGKKSISLLLFVSFVLFLTSRISLAALPPENQFTLAVIPLIISPILNILWIIFVGVSVVMFIIAGMNFLTARGDPSKVADARKFVIYGLVGVAVAIIGYSAVNLVNSALLGIG